MPLAPTHLTAQGGERQADRRLRPGLERLRREPGHLGVPGRLRRLDRRSTPTYNDDGELRAGASIQPDQRTPATRSSVRGVSSDGMPGPAASVTGTPFLPIGAPTHVAYTVSGNVVTITWDAPATPGTLRPGRLRRPRSATTSGQSGGLAFSARPRAPCTSARRRRLPARTTPSRSTRSTRRATPVTRPPDDERQRDRRRRPPSRPADGPLAIPSGTGSTGSVVKGEKVTLHGTGYAPNIARLGARLLHAAGADHHHDRRQRFVHRRGDGAGRTAGRPPHPGRGGC